MCLTHALPLQGELRLSLPPRTHPRLAALLEACLDHDHSRRPGFDEVAWQLQVRWRQWYVAAEGRWHGRWVGGWWDEVRLQ